MHSHTDRRGFRTDNIPQGQHCLAYMSVNSDKVNDLPVSVLIIIDADTWHQYTSQFSTLYCYWPVTVKTTKSIISVCIHHWRNVSDATTRNNERGSGACGINYLQTLIMHAPTCTFQVQSVTHEIKDSTVLNALDHWRDTTCKLTRPNNSNTL